MIGKRPIDLHLYALKSLGAIISEKNGKIQADCKKLKGQEINFPDRSVGATEQALLAAVLAEGETVLRNCAREPEITWLCRFLQKMGARICHEKEGCIRVQGVTRDRDADTGRPDRYGNISLRGCSFAWISDCGECT